MSSPNLVIRVLIDMNVMLDQLLQRDPWFTQAQSFWQAHDTNSIIALLPASSITDLHSIGVKQVGRDATRQGITWCLQELVIIPITRDILQAALSLAGTDFEDYVIITSAQSVQCQFITTVGCHTANPGIPSINSP